MFTGHGFATARRALDEIPIMDTHEHYGPQWNSPETTLYTLLRESYVGWLAHDGELRDDPGSVVRWLAPARDNAYTVSLLRGLSDLYDLGQGAWSNARFSRLADRVHRAYQEAGWALSALRKAGITHSIVDPLPEPGYLHEEPSFHLSLRSHMLVHGYDRSARDHGGQSPFVHAARMGCEISTFDDYLDFVDLWVREHKAKGAVALKSALAYERDIEVGPVTHEEAERLFDSGTQDPAARKRFGDFVLNLLAQKATEYGLVFQVHTGLARQASSHPHRLMWLLDNNPDTVFDLFHVGYPWLDEVLAMASERGNVIVNTCWLPIISPSAAVRCYLEYPEVAFRSDTLLWGGDNFHAEETYAAALTFKDCLAWAMAQKVAGGYWAPREALRYAEGVMWRAAARWYAIAG